ncbi:hypothetical protein ONS95_010965 [Cadophora gregata]|uniref:uncharacterized protein n=1 Tax=Cadophora gregata TaxID=51156 RepID=UPI0026DC8249|nr:uncharacterized protein ONS95_010965 [Cadophora gregata]KAK0119523.1 hypothetical protein ONS95_010965 [Cadophora gregata]KAK0120564.1 hypothetical protein ONS96_010768 [Cadophora gregata f. sp. sojae]
MHFPTTLTALTLALSTLVAGQNAHYSCSRQLTAQCCVSAGAGCSPITGPSTDFTCAAPTTGYCCLVSGGVIRLCTLAASAGVTTTISQTVALPTFTVVGRA